MNDFWRKTKLFFQPFFIALQFLTSIPVSQQGLPEPKNIGASLNWYPVVGAVLALILYVLAIGLLPLFSPFLCAALILTAWVMLTGALHLDGFADCADAWMGGLGSKRKTLKIMKDPTSGPIAVTALVLLLLIKFVALEALLSHGAIAMVIWPITFARTSASLLFVMTPYARSSGLGAPISEHLQVNVICCVTAFLLLIAGVVLGWMLLPLFISGAMAFWYLRKKMLRRIDGCTGDTAGALIELSEAFLLLVIVACLGLD
jgi:adenosylcobinamide-GDP ribazoletransferase